MRPLGADSETDDYGFSHSSETDDASAAGSAVQRAAAAGGVPGGATGGARRNGVEVGNASGGAAVGEDADLREYARSLGADPQDEEMAWLVREAFEAPRPPSWSEHVDAEGRLYFFNQVSEESTWSHPMDSVYRELIGLIRKIRPLQTLEQRAQAVREHLVEAHGRALAQLEGWSGPYNSDTGQYYHNDRLGHSTWISPIDEWEYELAVRHSVLHRGLLAGFCWPEEPPAASGGRPADLLTTPMLQLPLGLARREDDEKSSARSFYTARESARSGSSTVRSDMLPAKSRSGHHGAAAAAAASATRAPQAKAQATPPAKSADEAAGDGELEVTFGSSSPIKMPTISATMPA
mmetsp:Transcript_107952/g.300118  ORF Transcript_107952/g.300118 Transcript_107952/m.300118 type:complete len:350 (+) Transcript_107952:41-1090(+)|eukprot:CAMPEP_0176242820 /NCGR_PEP_ID=MMETSP0121_2-20121125/30603_1 /TAXON_ID=160619 /ORGANISM="Kryptoperidinium foliaceum, Strain CCMP 1326" /LENGTH=349 /DNA_ID=CAMNT_0017582389 /DNA_START=25 /DNA_END=1074 /DNA_ORIENTATION=+